MQSAKNAAASAKETAANIAASAKAGMEKTKATLQEKTDKMTTRDPLEKQLAEEGKEEKITEAELEKQQAREQHAAEKEATRADHTTGVAGRPGSNTQAALPGHGTGQPYGRVTSGAVESHPIETNTGTGATAARNALTGSNQTR